MNRAELKQSAKNSLKGKYGDAILMMIIFVGINFAAGFIVGLLGGAGEGASVITLLGDIITLVVSVLFQMGYTSYFLKISRNETVTYKELWSKTNLWLPFLLISLTTSLFTLLWSFLFIIPGIIASISYSLVYYILLDNPQITTMDAIKKSKEMMNGHKMDLFVLSLSFMGWIILGVFTFGILYFWLVPYMSVTQANFYNKLKESNQ